ncbi:MULTISPECIES: HNH endonuclease signature motif containing protein [unclassified Bradyrhizobium]|uniref:HNH endonuclease n=1 Tax=unclassified Bradyrhizobium TaxID=2631580 RepID=UPI00247A35D3|nr:MULTISPECIES: HNH endonuclease signature motif containing protein [unclassified Bradyrhizobium]WGS21698.1 HNH endonuclease [Bradyrhizobium sp. ISRA463]WGS28646.1 HNH endonuclease [Bradyrhizobium sp. ISRA464]
MAVADLTRQAVLDAIAEFDELRREPFLEKYGFGKSRGYFIEHNGKRYDSKAIAGAAHGKLGGGFQALSSGDFSGGDKAVARRLRQLRFAVPEPSDAKPIGIPYEIGNLYNRQRDIHQVYGGQERGGITTPSGCPFVFLFTGESGEQFGYSDGWRPDGIFAYTGEGQSGDMTFVRGNRAIRDHLADGRDLLLFEATRSKGSYRYIGCFAFAGFETVNAPDREGKQRKAIVFELVPVEAQSAPEDREEPDLDKKSLAELRELALTAAATPKAPSNESQRTYYARSIKVKAYVLKRANGVCEACKKAAPFLRKNGSPYLEPHHIKRVADGGPDHPASVGAVCPTCHRLIHHGAQGSELNSQLEIYVTQLEEELDSQALFTQNSASQINHKKAAHKNASP